LVLCCSFRALIFGIATLTTNEYIKLLQAVDRNDVRMMKGALGVTGEIPVTEL
jgi:hypothetical protein